MPKFDDYTQKTTPEDNDIALILDKTANVNKKTPFSGIWTWIVNKMTNAVIQNLQTTNKTVIGSINELNSNSFFTVESVPESNDLNDCKAKGNTRIHMWKMPVTSLNSPTSGAELFVFYIASSKPSDMYGTQIALAAYRNNIFIRLYADKEWDDWKSI